MDGFSHGIASFFSGVSFQLPAMLVFRDVHPLNYAKLRSPAKSETFSGLHVKSHDQLKGAG